MKNPILYRKSFRASPIRTGALLAVCLGVLTLSAQSGTSGSSHATSLPTNDHQDRTATPDANATMPTATAGSMTTADRSDSSMLKRGDRRFITKAAESSMKEVALSQLAQERATNPEVKNFAQQMVADHSQLNNDLMQLAQRKGVMLENATMVGSSTAMHSDATRSASASSTGTAATATPGGAMTGNDMADASRPAGSLRDSDATSDRHYRSLVIKSGADFDKEYVDLMIDDHESAVKLFEKTAKDAKDPEVRSFASSHLPTLQTHLQHVQSLMKSVAE